MKGKNMKKGNKEKETTKAEPKYPNMGDKVQKKKKPIKKKRKKLLKTPSHIIRLVMVWMYVILIFLLSTSYFTTTLYIKDDLTIGYDLSNATLTYADQKQVDNAADELEKALSELKKNGEKSLQSQNSSIAMSTASFDWKYHIARGINTERITELINKSKALDRTIYTEKTVKAVNDATLKAQYVLCATVTISQSALQIVLGGAVNNTSQEQLAGIIVSGIMMLVLVILPVVGFFIATFDKRRHIKNVYTILCCLTCITLIMTAVYPSIGIGAVASVILYIILFFLTAASIYAIQQERYIIAHPELEAEFTQKRPHFVKALINFKALSLTEKVEKQEAEEKQKELDKKKNKKKK